MSASIWAPSNSIIMDADAKDVTYQPNFTGVIELSVENKLNEVVSVLTFGADPTGAVDSLNAFVLALNASNFVLVPAGNYFLSNTLVVPQGKVLQGLFASSSFNTLTGSVLTFASSTIECLVLGGNAANNGSAEAHNLVITRAAGSIPVNSVGLKIQNLYAAKISGIFSSRQAFSYALVGDGSTKGLGYMVYNCWSAIVTTSHILIDSVPECRFLQCRFGSNGAFDLNCSSYIRIRGGSINNPASGPNTAVFNGCHFNQGQNKAAAWLEFVERTLGAINDATTWQISNCYVEAAEGGIKSDSSWNSITRLSIDNTIFNLGTGAISFLQLNSATGLDQWTLTNIQCFASITIAPSPQINFLLLSNSYILGDFNITGPTNGSTVNISNVFFGSNLTLAGIFSPFGALSIKNCSIAGTFINNCLGAELDLLPYNKLNGGTATLQFGGLSTGIVYSTNSVAYQIKGNIVYVQISLTLSNKGTATGNATILFTGLPLNSNQLYAAGNGNSSVFNLNMAAVAGNIVSKLDNNTLLLRLYQQGAAGVVALTNANFSNTSEISMNFSYFRD